VIALQGASVLARFDLQGRVTYSEAMLQFMRDFVQEGVA